MSEKPPSLPAPSELRAELETLRGRLASLHPDSEPKDNPGADAVLFRLLRGLSPERSDDVQAVLQGFPWVFLPLEDNAYPALSRLQARLDDLTHAAGHDDLTGLARRIVFDQALLTEMERARRSRLSLSLAILDIDDFKQINDDCGHVHGDLVLRTVTEVLRKNIRRADLAARLGGEEFALLMPATTQTSAVYLLERIMDAVRKLRFDCPTASGPQVTVSVGLACYKGFRDMLPVELVELADSALYSAKRTGKDRLEKAPFRDIAPDPASQTLVDTTEKNFLFHGLSS
ncbi:GGDEF domain-containing protein [Desulfonatronum sp. SC1]|uniref:GGDEF domain-containing protein n=1 Tax=Desulfonatronum sp. SC1 TaxID=2109626 RepID=UPI000D30E1B0|nr:GGDEF domain-containing protein [Desulfonatronum sp. SC1]PTN38062.1 GGDEF domain-containing protein [Desulfonatronum sp. SC1]